MRRLLLLYMGLMITGITMAAEEIASLNLDINIDYSNDPIYAEVWFWGIAAVPFLLLLLILIRGGRMKHQRQRVNEVESSSSQPGATEQSDIARQDRERGLQHRRGGSEG